MNQLLPPSVEHVRTTDVFDQDHQPAGLRRAHRVAEGVWARLVVLTGTVGFVFEDEPNHLIEARPDHPIVIPPGRPHHVEPAGPATFVIEFHREPDHTPPPIGSESTGLTAS